MLTLLFLEHMYIGYNTDHNLNIIISSMSYRFDVLQPYVF